MAERPASCPHGGYVHVHPNLHGSAGLMLVANGAVLLQQRANGGWSLPGGTRKRGEHPLLAAQRHTVKNTNADLSGMTIVATDEHTEACGAWTYTATLVTLPTQVAVELADQDGLDLQWVPFSRVNHRARHSDLRHAWHALSSLIPANA